MHTNTHHIHTKGSSVNLLRDRERPIKPIVEGLEEELLGIRGEVGCVDSGEVDPPWHGGGDNPVHNVKHLQQAATSEESGS